jgi:2'-5' RNA ligase
MKREPKELMRLFIAVFPPPATQRAAFEVAQSMRRPNDGVSWVKQENLHYTLHFLGDLGRDGLERAADAAREAASGSPPFAAALGGLGAFPNARRARVLWLSMTEGAEPLSVVSRGLETALKKRGFDRADHAFSPHLTIGRVREPRADWSERLASTRVSDAAALHFTVDRLLLMKSQLSPKGSIYTIEAEAPLEISVERA